MNTLKWIWDVPMLWIGRAWVVYYLATRFTVKRKMAEKG